MFRQGRGGISAKFEREEVELLVEVIRNYLTTLQERSLDTAVNKRLFPAASLDDDKVSEEYRALTIDELYAHKLVNARLVLATLPTGEAWRETLEPSETDAWLTVLTDLRLAIGTKLGVTDEMMDAEFDPATNWELAVMHYLGAMQESLVEALDR